MRGTSNRQKDVAKTLRRRQKQTRPAPPLPVSPLRKTGKPSIPKSQKT